MKVIDYYFSPVSPWTYLGHARVAEIARSNGSSINAKPVDYGVIFPVSGGLPLGKRAPQRQAYRLTELARWRNHLGLPLTIQPKYFPVDGSQAAYLIAAAGDDKSKTGGDAKDQKYWAIKKKTLSDSLERDSGYAEALQVRINALTTDFVNRDDPVQKSKIEQDRIKALAELDRLKKAITDDKKALSDLDEEARKAGVPPGWIR